MLRNTTKLLALVAGTLPSDPVLWGSILEHLPIETDYPNLIQLIYKEALYTRGYYLPLIIPTILKASYK